MYEAVSHSDDFRPGNTGMRLPGFLADTSRRLADDLNGFEGSVLMQAAPLELRKRQPGREFRCIARRQQHVE